MNINRRTFIKSSAGALLGAGIGLGLPLCRPANAAGKRMRKFHLSASVAKVNLGAGPDFNAYTYNGRVPGPEIRVREGDVVQVKLKNYLPEGTTIHWHGVPLENAMDGVPGITQPAIMPGETFVYEFEAAPAGSFIYHSHAGLQLDQGLYGPLIIEPLQEAGAYDQEFTLMLEDWVMKDGGGAADTERRQTGHMMGGMMGRRHGMRRDRGLPGDPMLEPVYDDHAVNGRVGPAIEDLEVRRGDRVRLRIMNPSSATQYYLRLAGHTLTITHADGNPIEPVEADVLRIGMGERYDVMFTADNPGYWLLAAAEQGYGESRLRIPIRYRGVRTKEPEGPDFHSGLRLVDYGDFSSLRDADWPSAPADRTYRQLLSGGMHSPYWTINNRVYPDADLLTVREGQKIRLRYWNRSMMPHPMHLHGHFFRLVNPALPPRRWVFKDTLVVDPMQRFDIEFMADNPGDWFHHCHHLYHMEAGMANVVAYRA
jgi:FtsP/CotA-like multicopper oxidase with cupredoxin domain